MASEIASRLYLTVGFVAFLELVALAVIPTTTTGWRKRLGRGWNGCANGSTRSPLGLLHYFFQSKLDVTNAAFPPACWSG